MDGTILAACQALAKEAQDILRKLVVIPFALIRRVLDSDWGWELDVKRRVTHHRRGYKQLHQGLGYGPDDLGLSMALVVYWLGQAA